jgi:hypothetical protein
MVQSATGWFQGLRPWRVQGRALALASLDYSGQETDISSLPVRHRGVERPRLPARAALGHSGRRFGASCSADQVSAPSSRADTGRLAAPLAPSGGLFRVTYLKRWPEVMTYPEAAGGSRVARCSRSPP